MRPIKVCSISAAAQRLAQRLPENPRGIPVKIGWDGQQIAVFSGTYASPAKSLPHARVLIPPGVQLDEIETMLALEVATLRRTLPVAMRTRPAQRAPRTGHHWRKGAIDPRRAGE